MTFGLSESALLEAWSRSVHRFLSDYNRDRIPKAVKKTTHSLPYPDLFSLISG